MVFDMRLLATLQITAQLIFLSRALPVDQRLTLADNWDSYYFSDPDGPGSYAYAYNVEDPESGNVQYKEEQKYPNGTVKGNYGYLEPDGTVRVVYYVADEFGYRATVETMKNEEVSSSFHHPPLTSRPQEQNLEAVRRPKVQQGLTQSFGPFSQSLGPFSQSVQEIRTPPKHQDTLPESLFSTNFWPDYDNI